MDNYMSGDQLLKILEALSNPYRLKIIAVLHKERQYVSQLARELGISRPLLYLHLQKLEDVDLIKGHLEVSENGKAMKYFELNSFALDLSDQLIFDLSKTLTLKNKKN